MLSHDVLGYILLTFGVALCLFWIAAIAMVVLIWYRTK